MRYDDPYWRNRATAAEAEVERLRLEADECLSCGRDADDLKARVEELEQAMAAEARIVEAQTLDLKALAKGRREILTNQVERMRRCALGGPGRSYTGRDWRNAVASALEKLGGPE